VTTARTLADIINEIRSTAWGKCVAALPNAPDELPNDPESRASARLIAALSEIDRRLRALEPCTSNSGGPHLASARRVDGSRLIDGDRWSDADHHVCALCGMRL
jgi:hypothetical protein